MKILGNAFLSFLLLAACGPSQSVLPPDSGQTYPDSTITTDRRAPADKALTDTTATPGCSPTVHSTQGIQTEIEIQRYRFVGGTADGKRLAVLLSHFGPSSHAPFVNLYLLEAENAKALLHRSMFLMSGGEPELAQLEKTILEQETESLKSLGIEEGKELPKVVPYCEAASSQVIADGVGPLRFTSQKESCAADPKITVTEWALCKSAPGSSCLKHTTSDTNDCVDGAAQLVNLYQSNGILWVVAEKRMEPFPGLFYRKREILGGKL